MRSATVREARKACRERRARSGVGICPARPPHGRPRVSKRHGAAVTTSPVDLPDGHRIIVRPIDTHDRPRLEAAFARLSTESRYRRFLASTPDLTPRQFDYHANVDHHDHEALVALEDGGTVLIG